MAPAAIVTDPKGEADTSHEPVGPPEYHNVIAVGAGVTSLALACQLQTMIGERDILLLEREAGLGGTWWSNTYPGAGVCTCVWRWARGTCLTLFFHLPFTVRHSHPTLLFQLCTEAGLVLVLCFAR